MIHEISLSEYVDTGRATLRKRVTAVIRDREDVRYTLNAGERAMSILDRIHDLLDEAEEREHGARQLELFEVLT